MKTRTILIAAFAALSFAAVPVPSHAAAPSSVKPFLGRWDLTLKTPGRDYPSWIEIQDTGGQLSATFVGRWGNARPLPKIEIHGAHLTFVSPAAEEGRKTDMIFNGALAGSALSGTTTGPDGTPWKWTGVRAPSLARAHSPVWGKPIRLFNGKNLAGWKPSRPGPPDWTVENGVLIKPANGAELITNRKFTDFRLHLEFNCGPDANSGVYLRGRYETQIETESAAASAAHHTGAIYGFIAPNPELSRNPNVWQTYDITLIGRRVTVVQNGVRIIDNQEIPGITGGALDSHEALPGPIYLQGSEAGQVKFRDIVITPAE